MKRNIKIILIIGLISGSVIGGIFTARKLFSVFQENPELTRIKKDFERCQKFENVGPPLARGISEKYFEGGEVFFPKEEILETEKALDCFGFHDQYFCDWFETEEEKENCRSFFYLLKAIRENKPQYCKNTGEREVLCSALLSGNETLCEKNQLGEEMKIWCQVIVANNIEICNNFKKESKIQQCQDDFYLLSALLKNDISLCDKMKNKRRAQVFCRGALDVEECLKYYSQVQCKEIYLPQLAEVTKDPSICEEIPYKNEDDKGKFFYQLCLNKAK